MMTTSASSEPPALGPLLAAIESPADVKAIADGDLQPLAAAVRHSLITSLATMCEPPGPKLAVW